MKKLLLLPLLFLSLISTPCLSETIDELVKRDGIYYKKFSDTPFTGKTTEYYDSGQLKEKVNWKNGERGDEIYYYENGQSRLRKNYNGKLNSVLVSYYKNGQLKSKSNWKNGELDGESVDYYENGQLENRSYYNNWVPGDSVSYYKNGQLKAKKNRENGSQVYWVKYDKNGNIVYEEKNGKVIFGEIK